MASQTIEYIWKIARPKNETIARALMHAAYETAIQTDPNTTRVLIRSYIHPSTRTRGKYVKDEPHITVAVKNPQLSLNKQHRSNHGYTPHIRSFDVTRVSPADGLTNDGASSAWPDSVETKVKETIAGPPAVLGPKSQFITWPSEETGE
ncbi:hypothetical protein RJ035_003245 [Blastomyces gilchristii]|nr:hypothetical protein BDFG_01363 [Blastomyces dermatitidis ATCC 26199]